MCVCGTAAVPRLTPIAVPASACVRMLDWFEHAGHVCIVFELLGLSTAAVLEQNEFLPFSVEQIRHMAFQIFRAVCCESSVRFHHVTSDLAPI